MKIIPMIFIVTAVKDDWLHTQKLLKCIKDQSYKNVHLVVVDDGSIDNSSKKIKMYLKNSSIIKGDGNLWWTGSLFKAIEYVESISTECDYVLTINNDCTFNKNYIRDILNTSIKYPNSVIGSQVIDINNPKNIIGSSANFDWLRGSIFRTPKGQNIETLTTRGTLFPIKIIRKVGNFDFKHLPHYGSDIEYTYRIWKLGYKLYVNEKCIIYLDTKRTGTAGPKDDSQSWIDIKNILFSRKSQLNVIDHFNLIYLCCPWYLQPLNYLFLIGKVLYLISFIEAFYIFRKPLSKLRRFIHSY